MSRNDGNIIKATGCLEDASEHPGNGSTPLDTVSPTPGHLESVAAASAEDRHGADGRTGTRARAEKLAADIFHFVSVASFLSASVHLTASERGPSSMYNDGSTYSRSGSGASVDEAAHEREANEVQLLRMRSKKYEVIIFPDPNFLCCVVQNVERQVK